MKPHEERPLFLRPGSALVFPDPRRYNDEGLVAIGGDLSEARLLAAYRAGVFPWYNKGYPLLWWCPNPRAVLTAPRLHVSKSMQRVLRTSGLRLTYDRAFSQVIQACGEKRSGGTWILPEMKAAYVALHESGHAHSIEVWAEQKLVGGLYGVQCGALFAAESMFHREPNASKLALISGFRAFAGCGIQLFDVQFATEHLKSLGVFEISRDDYLAEVARLSVLEVDLGRALCAVV